MTVVEAALTRNHRERGPGLPIAQRTAQFIPTALDSGDEPFQAPSGQIRDRLNVADLRDEER
ncbi:hypothetical protein ACWDKQ_15530, partial [Saccharopolyspora sp. NPDC000995]